ncbi:hypothetical protein NADE_003571 [Nannochloris sp. 'desiccata']|nr:hypothetical protein KSW81_000405 [Chlorella desiccata (nom. nud.)]KAH7620962.1 hypothetical protein NADE_003571 [Chlorella desiccata (nom. nud.)]
MSDRQFEDEEFETSAPRARTASISTMGQLLLQGYAMLADSCQTCGVPLMRKPNSDEIICVNCNLADDRQQLPQPAPSTLALPLGIANGNHIHEEEEEEEIEAAPRPLRERTTPYLLPEATTTSRNAGQVDSSQAIADKMLEGWALLAEHCPLCSTPFVRSRDGRIYCVTCDLYAVREGESAQQQLNRAGAGLSSTSPPRISASSGAAVPSSSRNTIQVYAEESSIEDNAAVTRNIATAQSSVAARLARTAAALESATSIEATAFLQEIQACVEALNGMRALLS